MFLLVTGTAEVRIARDGQSTVVATLGPGACLGEMSVLTGDPRAATVVAMEEVEAVEIGKQPFTTLVRDNPDVVARLTELLARRQLANEKLAAGAGHAERTAEARASVLRKLRAFFQLGDRT
jgi:CRP-like cAMP-binding protein